MTVTLKHKLYGLAIALGACIVIAGIYLILNPSGPGVFTVPADQQAYTDADHGFAIDYPKTWNLNTRSTDVQDSDYLGLKTKFFISIADPTKSDKPETIARFYAADGVTVDQFTSALLASDPGNITIKETTDVTENGLPMKKIVNTTASGVDKTQYVFLHDQTLVIVSVILQQDDAFAPLLASMRPVK